MFIPDPDFYSSRIPDLGYRIQGSKKHRIPDPDPQHCLKVLSREMDPAEIRFIRSVEIFGKYLPVPHAVSALVLKLQ
jgi:hypothetical protein